MKQIQHQSKNKGIMICGHGKPWIKTPEREFGFRPQKGLKSVFANIWPVEYGFFGVSAPKYSHGTATAYCPARLFEENFACRAVVCCDNTAKNRHSSVTDDVRRKERRLHITLWSWAWFTRRHDEAFKRAIYESLGLDSTKSRNLYEHLLVVMWSRNFMIHPLMPGRTAASS